ncbi:hypothetical protein GGX14DRAFT_384413 [Mycena pura]|uniref:Secreted protein n=1 Tax=Mycena pura TaxID=153505 RepID=A0AAD6YVC9_9AGAR|nr:hypothetical protein GGX14DRAFT_384413 [Mycena pura]
MLSPFHAIVLAIAALRLPLAGPSIHNGAADMPGFSSALLREASMASATWGVENKPMQRAPAEYKQAHTRMSVHRDVHREQRVEPARTRSDMRAVASGGYREEGGTLILPAALPD